MLIVGFSRGRWTIAGLMLAGMHCCGDLPATAATRTWNNTATGTSWSVSSNWGGFVPLSTDIGQFASPSYNAQPSLITSASIGGIWVTGSGNVAISGTSPLTLYGTTISGNTATSIQVDPGGGPLTINSPLILQNDQRWFNNSQNPIAVNGNVSGNGKLTKSGTGTLTLSGTFAASGGVTIDGGTLQVSGGSLVPGYEYVGYSGTGSVSQLGGTNSPSYGFYLGYNSGSSGRYNFSGGSLTSYSLYSGYYGSGSFTQTGGTNTLSNGSLYLGYMVGSSGSYNLGGSGLLSSAYSEYIGNSGSGSFTQSGGVNSVSQNLYLHYSGSSASYNLSGGSLYVQSAQSGGLATEYLGYSYYPSGSGTFTQSGGTNQTQVLSFSGSIETYSLSGNGLLSVSTSERIPNAGNLFQQSGGTNTTGFIQIGGSNPGGGLYRFTGGLLQLASGISTTGGTLDCNGGTGTILASNSIVDFSGKVINTSSTSLAVGANSLLIVPAGFNPAAFGSFSNLGLTDTVGSPLTVAAGNGFTGNGTVPDHVNCQGSIIASPSGSITLNGGLSLSGTGQVNLGLASLNVNDASSGMSGGSLGIAGLNIGASTTGSFTQTGGTNSIAQYFYVGSFGGSGTYGLSGGSLSANSICVGAFNNGSFTQSNGTNSNNGLIVGWNGNNDTNLIGTYLLGGGTLNSSSQQVIGSSGTGSFVQTGGSNSTGYQYVGTSSSGSFTQSAGVNSVSQDLYLGYYSGGSGSFSQSGGVNQVSHDLYLGYNSGSSGSYNLAGGSLVSNSLYFGYSGSGSFIQSGGTNQTQVLSFYGSNETYKLSGSGLLSVSTSEQIPGPGNLFQQTGGTNIAGYVDLSGGGNYRLTGGLLQLVNGLKTAGGTLDFGGGSATVRSGSNAIVDLSGSVGNTASTSLSIGANSLLILPAGFNPANFGSFSNLGVTYIQGSALNVPADTGFAYSGTIADHVNCQGTIIPSPNGSINLNGGLTLSGTGLVNLGSGTLTVNDAISGMSGGSLAMGGLTVGTSAAGSFTQSGGTYSITQALYQPHDVYLGYNLGGSGTYNLLGGSLSVGSIYVGNSGSGSFTQTGGANSLGTSLYLGYNTGSNGTYTQSSGSLLNASTEYIGYSGSGGFTQTGGVNSIDNLQLGSNVGSSGAYTLGGSGVLSSNDLGVGSYGNGSFVQSGGTNAINNQLDIEGNAGGIGSYNLNGNGLLTASSGEYIGGSSGGSFTQSGGTNTTNQLILSLGTYALSGSGLLLSNQEQIGVGSTGNFVQSGGTNSVANELYIENGIYGNGTYTLSGGLLLASSAYEHIGRFSQSGGTHNAGWLTITGGTGSYTLGGGLLNAYQESFDSSGGSFVQNGGTNSAAFLDLNHGNYRLNAGLLQIGGLRTAGGTLDCGNGTVTIQATSAIVDLTGSVVNSSSASMTIGPNSLLIVAPGFNPAIFGNFTNAGLTEQLGSVLNVPSGTVIGGWGTVPDHVNCQGTIAASPSGGLSLNNGLTLSGTGQANLGSGRLVVNDSISSMGNQWLATGSTLIGTSGAGSFSQSGGTNAVSSYLLLGTDTGGSGVYNLTGGSLSSYWTSPGYFSSGTLNQSGGTHTAVELTIAEFSGVGAYNLTAGRLTAGFEVVGGSGTGSFTQSGGTHVAAAIYLGTGQFGGTTGKYNLNGGLLAVGAGGINAGRNGAIFNFTGGTLGSAAPWSSSIDLALAGTGSAATIDASGGSIGLSGNLTGAGTLSKVGRDLLLLSGTNSHVGSLIVDGGTLQIPSGSLTAAAEYVGYSGSGTVAQTGGTNTIDSALYLAVNPGSIGTYNLAGGLLIVSSILKGSGTASLIITGGTLTGGASGAIINVPIFLNSMQTTATIRADNLLTAQAPISGSGDVTKSGSGTLVLTQSNSYSGDTIISQGAVQIANANAVMNSTVVANVPNALAFAPPSGSTVNIGGLSGSGSFTLSDSNGFPVSLVVGGNNDDMTFSGTISGPGTVIKAGSGVLQLAHTNSWTGGFILDPGVVAVSSDAALGAPTGMANWGGLSGNIIFAANCTLRMQDSFAMSVNRSIAVNTGAIALLDIAGSTATIGGAISGPGGLSKTGSGTLVLYGVNTYTDMTSIAAGTLKLDFSQPGAPLANIINNAANSSSLAMSGGTLVIQGNPGASSSQQFNGLIVNPGCSAIVLASASKPLLLVLGGIGATPGGTVDFTLPDGTQSAANGITTSNANTNNILGAYATVGGTDWACVSGAAGNIAPYSAYTGGNLGLLNSNGVLNLEPTGTQTAITSARSFNTLNLTGTQGVTMTGAGALTLLAGGLIGNTSGSINGGTLSSSPGGQLVVVAAADLTVGSVIADNGAATGLTKAGPATLILTGNNRYSGPTTIGAGSLQIGNGGTDGSLGTGPVINNGTLIFNVAYAASFGGIISGGGPLVKTGSGPLLLSGANAFSGPTRVNQGALLLANSAALRNSTVVINSDDGLQFGPSVHTFVVGGIAGPNLLQLADTTGSPVTLVVGNNGASTNFAGPIGGNGSLVKTGNGSLVLSGLAGFGGGTLIAGGVLQIGNGGTSGGLSGNVTDNAALIFNRSDNFTFGGVISGSGSLTQAGDGVLTLSNGNPFSGSATVSSGAISLNNANALPNSTLTVATNGGLRFNTNNGAITTFSVGGLAGGGNIALADGNRPVTLSIGGIGYSPVYGGALSDKGAITVTGDGAQALCGMNSYLGPTTIVGGTLLLDFGQPSAPAANIVNNLSNSSTLALGGGTLAIQGNVNTTNGQRFNGLSVNPGCSAIVVTAAASNSVLLSLGSITHSAGGTVDFTLPAGEQSATNGITTTTPNTPAGILGGYATVGGSDWACSTGSAGNITAFNAYVSGDLGSIALANTSNLMPSGPQTALTSSQTCSTINLTKAVGVTMSGAGSLVLAGGGLIGNTLGAISGGVLCGSPSGELVVVTPQDLAIDSVIADNGGATALIKTGTATLIVTGINRYSGGTTISAGTLQVGNGAYRGALSNGPMIDNSALVFNIAGFATFADAISGSGSLTQAGPGTLVLTGSNTYSGATIVAGGALKVTNPAALLDGADLIVGNGGTVSRPIFSGTAAWSGGAGGAWDSPFNWTDQIQPGASGVPGITGSGSTQAAIFGSIAAASSAAVTLGPAVPDLARLQFAGTTAYNLAGATGGGKLVLDAGSGTATISNSAAAGQQINVPIDLLSTASIFNMSGSTLTISGQISATQIMTVSGGGTLVLSGSTNTFPTLDVMGGTVVLTDSGSLADEASLFVGEASLFPAPMMPSAVTFAGFTGAIAVPEPAALALLATSSLVAASAACRRRTRRGIKGQGV
jgi:autotransporter-associated beta strand protein